MANLRSKRAIAIAAATVVAAVGAGAAVAATSNSTRPSDFLDSVARHLGISRQKLDDATKAAAIDQVNADLAAGRITQSLADELKKRIEAGDVPPLGYGRFGGGGPGIPPIAGGPGLVKPFIDGGLEAAAKYLGLSESDLRSKLGNGQSLADIAKAQNKDVSGLEDAVVAAEKAQLDKAVADKKLTQSQADQALSTLKSHVDDIVNGALRFGGRGGPGGPGGPGFGHGFRFGAGDTLSAAAKYLGLSESDLRSKLGNGQSLADIAKAQNKDVSGLEDALVAAEKAQLDKAVTAKALTQSQADQALSNFKSHVDDLVNANQPDRPRMERRGAGPRFFFGP
jgi:predicted XRE-type DNA-binding protein